MTEKESPERPDRVPELPEHPDAPPVEVPGGPKDDEPKPADGNVPIPPSPPGGGG